ncbi:sterile alpha motif domain-containing protein 3-like [Erpetoichthys calabaricus]|uniref:sterile alpha motif domain-containing protein 3-like n=1 Tax=Erpetoichthys calabaricus TaxID=27687 RepID=UPI0022348DB3|nr:sterile alpha motif domain-containing protein 3-like [Erpetoichthys calabaricus]
MSTITAYPSKDQYDSVAKALVERHPCLKEPGSGKGWHCWVYSLKFKMGNYRQSLSAAGCPEVVVNKRKRADYKGKCVKKSKKGEIHYLPDPPEGQSAEDTEEKRKLIVTEMQKKEPDLQVVDELMISTFSQRRKEIVGGEPLISEIFNRWPALFTERQISAEFKRIVTTDLLQPFLEGLDGLVPRLLEVYKAAAMSGRKLSLKSILQCLEKDDTNQKRRTAALLGLPYYISEDPSGIIKTCDAHGEQLDVIMKGMQVGLLIGHEGVLQDTFPHEVFKVAVVVEETIILHSLQNVPEGFAMLMGIIYCFNQEYPQKMKYTFEFLQRVVMQIKPDQGSARIHGLRNKLLRYRV